MSLRDAGWPLSGDGLGPALDGLLESLPRRPGLLGLGEPMHGEEAFPRLRNAMLAHLVAHEGYRSVALESDCLAGLAVDAYAAGGPGELDEVLATGFSHGFGASAANRELVSWLREHNATREPADRITLYGFDPPIEMMGATSPRRALCLLHDYLTAYLEPALVPGSRAAVLRLTGDDGRWNDPAAALDPARSVGGTAAATELRILTDDLIAVLHTESPRLIAATSLEQWRRAALAGRTGAGLLRYHVLMARSSPTRVARLLGERDAMMAANLLAIREAEARRGPTLVFAHNQHLQRQESSWRLADMDLTWWSAGAMAGARLGDDYAFLASTMGSALGQGIGAADPATLEGVLATVPEDSFLFATDRLGTALVKTGPGPLPRTGAVPDHGYFGLDPAHLGRTEGVVFFREIP